MESLKVKVDVFIPRGLFNKEKELSITLEVPEDCPTREVIDLACKDFKENHTFLWIDDPSELILVVKKQRIII